MAQANTPGYYSAHHYSYKYQWRKRNHLQSAGACNSYRRLLYIASGRIIRQIWYGFSGCYIHASPDGYLRAIPRAMLFKSADRGFQPLIKVVEESSQPDVGIASLTNPVCGYNTDNPVAFGLRNFSSAIHDFATNPVTITGSVINDKTNINHAFYNYKKYWYIGGWCN